MLRINARTLTALAVIQALGVVVEVPSGLATPAWDLLPPPSGPGAIVYDSRRHRELWLMQGGILAVPDAPAVSWERVWRGNNPARQFGEFVVYDSTSDRIWTATSSQQWGSTSIPGKVWCIDLSAAELQWTEVAFLGNVPSVGGYGYALDPVRRRILTFGGNNLCSFCEHQSSVVYALTLDGTPTWGQVSTAGWPVPTPRSGSAMVYDPWRDRMIVYGGLAYGPSYFDETWSLSLGVTMSWELLPPTQGIPPARAQSWAGAAALDPIGRRWMILGGESGPNSGDEYNDTWALDLSSAAPADSAAWTPIADGASDSRPRLGPTVFCQPLQSRMVLARGDLWALSLDAHPAWSVIGGDSLGYLSRKGFIAFLDPATRRVYAGLGTDDSLQVRSADVISWWKTLPEHGPSARYGACVGVDEAGRRALVFGGGTNRGQQLGTEFSELWSFDLDGSGWTQLAASPTPPARTAALGLFDTNHRRFIIHGGRATSFDHEIHLEDTWAYDAATGVWSPVGGVGYEWRFGEIGIYDPVRDRIVACGGAGWTGPDVHILTLGSTVGTWSAVSTSGTPPPFLLDDYGFGLEAGAYASYDPVGDRMIVMSKDGSANDYNGAFGVWQLTLGTNPTWSKLDQDWAPAPANVFMPGAAVFDEQGGRMLLMGGTGDWRILQPTDPGFWGLYLDGTPPTWVSLVSADATSNQVQLQWQAAEPRNLTVDVQRRSVGGSWEPVAQQTQDATGGIMFVDQAVTQGTRYDYRLAVGEPGFEGYYGETRIGVPSTTDTPTVPDGTLVGVRPNPTQGPLAVTFSLPRGGPASLKVFDVTGRQVMTRAVGALGPGTHTLHLELRESALKAGLYFLRLEQTGRESIARFVVVR